MATCVCGKEVHNGGSRTNHQRSCHAYMLARIRSCQEIIDGIDAGTWGAHRSEQALAGFRSRREDEIRRLRRDLNPPQPAATPMLLVR